MNVFVIDDPNDERIADYVRLKDATLVKKRGVFVAEGTEVVRTALTRGRFALRSVFLLDKRLEGISDALANFDGPVYVATPAVMNEVVGFDIHRGCLAAGAIPSPTDPMSIVPADGPATVLVLEALANHDNVGGAFRNAAAFGVDAVWLDPRSADPLYRKAIRTSMGATLTTPFARITDWPNGLERLRAAGFRVVALSPSGDVPLHSLGESERIAILVGTEGAGLSAEAMAAADTTARIEMAAGHDSLNVATAAAIGLYAVLAGSTRVG